MKDEDKIYIKNWGVRGSIPSPLSSREIFTKASTILKNFTESPEYSSKNIENFMKTADIRTSGTYGHNTISTEIYDSKHSIMIDGGSGLRSLGISKLKGPLGAGAGTAHIFLTHVHWDHIMGIPFFIPIFLKGNTIHFYGVGNHFKKAVKTLFKKPFFPVSFRDKKKLGARIKFHTLKPRKTVMVNSFSVTPYRLDHPDPCWGYRIEKNGRSYAHAVDTEITRFHEKELGPDRFLYKKTDTLQIDSQYSLIEYHNKTDWGHASSNKGYDLARHFGIKKVIFTHHDPTATDAILFEAEQNILKYKQIQIDAHPEKHAPPEPCFAKEEEIIEV